MLDHQLNFTYIFVLSANFPMQFVRTRDKNNMYWQNHNYILEACRDKIEICMYLHNYRSYSKFGRMEPMQLTSLSMRMGLSSIYQPHNSTVNKQYTRQPQEKKVDHKCKIQAGIGAYCLQICEFRDFSSYLIGQKQSVIVCYSITALRSFFFLCLRAQIKANQFRSLLQNCKWIGAENLRHLFARDVFLIQFTFKIIFSERICTYCFFRNVLSRTINQNLK